VPVFRLDARLAFPPVERAEPSGLLAIGGDLSIERLLLAYASGIFPWYNERQPLLWHSPDPRYVLESRELHVSKSLEKQIRRGRYEVRFDTVFRAVIEACSEIDRPGQIGTWITPEMIDSYVELHDRGFAHSAEAFENGVLVGGLYGVSLGGVFFGESMYADAPDASKVAFVTLVRWMLEQGIDLVDSQVYTEHLERFGAVAWPRPRYIEELERRLARPTLRGTWRAPSRAPSKESDDP
jgi:leucyl/phenylalanyl-tRNA--protein transferase